MRANCVLFNANSVKNKIAELIYFLNKHKIDIAFLSETQLRANHKFRVKGYNIEREDRPDRTDGNLMKQGGGVAFVIRNNIPYCRLQTRHTSSIEHVAVRLDNGLVLVGVYVQPKTDIVWSEVDQLLALGSKVIIAGDFNSRHEQWGCLSNNKNGRYMSRYLEETQVALMYTDTPTHFPSNGQTPSTMDFIINKNVSNLSEPYTVCEMSSDHDPVLFTIGEVFKENPAKPMWDYKNTNWEEYRKHINAILKTKYVSQEREIDEMVSNFTNIMLNARLKTTKQIKQIQQDKIPDEIISLIHQKQKFRKQWQRTRNDADRVRFRELARQIRERIIDYRSTVWQTKLENLKPGSNEVWNVVRSLKKRYENIPTLIDQDKEHVNNRQKAECFGEYYRDNFKTLSDTNQVHIDTTVRAKQLRDTPIVSINSKTFSKILVTPLEVYEIIKELPIKKSPGVDEVDTILLKNLPPKGFTHLANITNGIIKLQSYPDCLKKALIVPILKPGKSKNRADSYRPISLLSITAKVIDKIILKRIGGETKKLKIIPHEQFGFRSGHSTVSQVVRIVHAAKENINCKRNTVAAFLDMRKAFDTVWIERLLVKMWDGGFPLYLVKLINSYLDNRTISVKVQNTISSQYPVQAGVPQGSALSPLLYSIYTSDVPKFEKTNLALYADDTCVYAHSFSSEVACRQVQLHIDRILLPYYLDNKLVINPEKTELINITKKHTNNKIFNDLNVCGNKIKPKRYIKYLGLTIDRSVCWKSHIDTVASKINGLIKTLYPLICKRSKVNLPTKLLIFKQIFRPVLTYGCPAFCSASNTQMVRLQRLQNRVLRIITDSDRYTPVRRIHEKAKVPLLNDYVLKLSLKFYKSHLRGSILTRDIISTHIQQPMARKHGLIYEALLPHL